MSFKVYSIPAFDKQAKRLSKKFSSLKKDLGGLIDTLESKPKQGTSIGKDCYKIRLAIKSKGKGKSGGARVITHIQIKDKNVYLLSIFDKSEQDSLTDKKLLSLISQIEE